MSIWLQATLLVLGTFALAAVLITYIHWIADRDLSRPVTLALIYVPMGVALVAGISWAYG